MGLLRRTSGLLRRNAVPSLVLAISLVVTAFSFWYVRGQVRENLDRRFGMSVFRTTAALHQRMQAYLDVLLAGRALFAAADEGVERADFREFVRSMNVRTRYPGFQGIGWAVALEPDEVRPFEDDVRSNGFPGFEVWPQGERPFYTAIRYLEPFDWRNRRAFGYDMASEPTRRRAMERARDTGEPATTGRVVLVQEVEKGRQFGFLIYVPVYEKGVPETVAQRRATLRGWVYAPFRAGDFFESLFPGDTRPVEIEVYDGGAVAPQRLLYRSTEGDLAALEDRPPLHRLTQIDVGGRPWTLFFTPRPGFWEATATGLPWVVLLSGLVLSGLLFTVTWQQSNAREMAEAASRRATFLAESGTLLAESLDPDVTLDNLAQLAVPAMADLCTLDLLEGGLLHQKAAVAAHPARLPVMHRAPRAPRTEARVGISRVVRTGLSELYPRVDEGVLRANARDEAEFGSMLELQVLSAMFVPLKTRGEVRGVLAFATTADSDRRYGSEDLELAEELARRASLALDNARLYREARDAIEVRDEFLSIASHELKTPLTSLQLQAQSVVRGLGRGGMDPSRLGHKVESIHRQVDRLAVLINELLDVSRITAGRLTFHLEPVDLGGVVKEVLERFSDEFARADCQLIDEVQGPVVGRWDRLRLEQVVTNLVSNAVKYGAGGPVEVQVGTVDGEARLLVRDRGMGIGPEDLARIFERFERAVSQRHYGGMGLGLWIVRQIVEGLGGRIEVHSELGEGSTFLVHLPLGAAESRPAPPRRLGTGSLGP